MTRLVDAKEREETRLLDLAMDNAIAGADIGESSLRVARRIDHVSHNLSTEPVAVVIRITIVQHDLNARIEQLLASRNGT